jgi:hypothetical protein
LLSESAQSLPSARLLSGEIIKFQICLGNNQ